MTERILRRSRLLFVPVAEIIIALRSFCSNGQKTGHDKIFITSGKLTVFLTKHTF